MLHEAHQVGDGRPRAHSAVMNSRQARNWLRIEMSLVPLAVSSAAPASAGSKLRCRLTHSFPCAARPSWIAPVAMQVVVPDDRHRRVDEAVVGHGALEQHVGRAFRRKVQDSSSVLSAASGRATRIDWIAPLMVRLG